MTIGEIFSTLNEPRKREMLDEINEVLFESDGENTREVEEISTEKLDALFKDWHSTISSGQIVKLNARAKLIAIAQYRNQ